MSLRRYCFFGHKIFFRLALSVGVSTLFLALPTLSTPTPTITYHGKLTDTSNVPVQDTTYNFTISIYDAPINGNCLWTARGTCTAKQAKPLTTTQGIFHTTLGEQGDNPLTLTFNDNYYLEVQINANAPMNPRRTITLTGAAINATRLNGQSHDYYLNTNDNQTKSGSLTLNNNLALKSTLTDKNNSVGTDGQVLTSTVTGTQWKSLSDLGIGDNTFQNLTDTPSTFTNGALYFATTNSVAQDPNLTWDNTNKRLGIGTQSPASALTVHSQTSQLQLGYDNNNRLTATTNATGHTTLAATGTNSGITLSSATGTTQSGTMCTTQFAEVDFSRANNDYEGFYNAPNYPITFIFAFIKADGSLAAWGNAANGGTNVPAGTNYTKIYSNEQAFAALKSDGSIATWGAPWFGGSGAPTGAGYTEICSTFDAFAALRSDGSIAAWGTSGSGGSGAPSGNGYAKIYSNRRAFAAMKADGSITAWGSAGHGGTGAPSGTGYTKIYSTQYAFAALKSDGSITAWGDATSGGTGAPTDSGYTAIYSTHSAFAALKSDGSITAWGDPNYGGTGAPSGTGYTAIYSTNNAFAALKSDGSITAWGDATSGGTGAPSGTGYTKIYSNQRVFAAMKSDGSITAWGHGWSGGNGAPSGTGYTAIYSTHSAFAALKSDGSITAWGDPNYGGTGAPSDSGYTKIYSTFGAFAALKPDGTITAWGNSNQGGTNAPTSTCAQATISTATSLTLDTNGLTYKDSLNNTIFSANPLGIINPNSFTLHVNGSIGTTQDGIYNLGSPTNRFNTLYAVNGTATTSDINYKKNIVPLTYGLNEILNITPISFNWKDDAFGTTTKLGLSAQELRKIIPEAVTENNDTLSVFYADLIPVTINAIKQQHALFQTTTDTLAKNHQTLTDTVATMNNDLSRLATIQKMQSDILTLKKDTHNYATVLEDLTLQLEHAQAGITLLTAMSTNDTTDLSNLLAIDPTRILLKDDAITVSDLTANTITARAVSANTFSTPTSAGTATITKDDTSVTVHAPTVTTNSRIMVTPRTPITIGVTKVMPGKGFEVETDKDGLRAEDVIVDWWIVGSDDAAKKDES